MAIKIAGAVIVFTAVLAVVTIAPETEAVLGRLAGLGLAMLFAALTYLIYFRKIE